MSGRRSVRAIGPQPLVAVHDVGAAGAYRHLLGCQRAHGGREDERLVSSREVVMQLRQWVHIHAGRRAVKWRADADGTRFFISPSALIDDTAPAAVADIR